MANFTPFTTVGWRTVDVNGNVIRGPLYFQTVPGTNPLKRWPGGWISNVTSLTAGLTANVNLAYVPEMIGPPVMADWSKVAILNGYRAMLEFDFTEILFDASQSTGTFGYGLLLNFYADSLRASAPTYAPLQMNLFAAQGSNQWRGMIPTTPWKPTWLAGKQGSMAMQLKLTFESRALLSDITALQNDLGAYLW